MSRGHLGRVYTQSSARDYQSTREYKKRREIPEVINRETRRAAASMKRKQKENN
jgi:hypothetical protein